MSLCYNNRYCDLATASVCITKFILADVYMVTHFLEERYRTIIFAKLGEASVTKANFKATPFRDLIVRCFQ